MGKYDHLVGLVFNRLTINRVWVYNQNNIWRLMAECSCVCGNVIQVRICAIKSGNTKSCGCLNSELIAVLGRSKKKHGMTGTSLYRIWSNMKTRCLNKRNRAYQRYGGRGISICQRWMVFQNFVEDMGIPERGMSIDRIDNNGNYEKSNCRWATATEQSRNRRSNIVLTHMGESKLLSDWSRETGINRTTIMSRINRGWSIDDAISVCPR